MHVFSWARGPGRTQKGCGLGAVEEVSPGCGVSCSEVPRRSEGLGTLVWPWAEAAEEPLPNQGAPQEVGAWRQTAGPPRLWVCGLEAPAVPGSVCSKDSFPEASRGAEHVLAMSTLKQWDPRQPLATGLNAHREMRKVGQSPDSNSGWSRPVHNSMDPATSTLKSLLMGPPG